MVRLEAPALRQYMRADRFQFLVVRLEVTPNSFLQSAIEFQFLVVRLEEAGSLK